MGAIDRQRHKIFYAVGLLKFKLRDQHINVTKQQLMYSSILSKGEKAKETIYFGDIVFLKGVFGDNSFTSYKFYIRRLKSDA
jgi:hypothetical protein